jgi:hypothetical protein
LPVQWHALALGLFASIIAPFGGFFASGFKRAFKIKVEFASSLTVLRSTLNKWLEKYIVFKSIDVYYLSIYL